DLTSPGIHTHRVPGFDHVKLYVRAVYNEGVFHRGAEGGAAGGDGVGAVAYGYAVSAGIVDEVRLPVDGERNSRYAFTCTVHTITVHILIHHTGQEITGTGAREFLGEHRDIQVPSFSHEI